MCIGGGGTQAVLGEGLQPAGEAEEPFKREEGGVMRADPGQNRWRLKGGNQWKKKGADVGTSWR